MKFMGNMKRIRKVGNIIEIWDQDDLDYLKSCGIPKLKGLSEGIESITIPVKKKKGIK